MEVNVQIPQALAPVFAPPIGAVAYRGAYGGRGSAKTRTFARMVAVRALVFETMGLRGAILCGREFMGSLADSSMEELKSVIQEDEWLAAHFSIGKEYIRTKSGNIWFLFVGLRHNLDSLKSKAKVLLTWIDEAENVSELAWRKLIATVMREPNSEIWLTWNPESEESATHKRFRVSYDPKRMVIVECNYSDNPWFPQGLEDERKADLEFRPDTYDHIWEGQFLTLTEAQIMAGKYEVKEFEVDGPGWQGPYLGGDFGYSQDPTAAIRSWVKDNCLYIDYEAGGTRIEIDDIVSRVSASIPDYDKHVSRWDSAQPGMISHIQRKGFHRAIGCVKGKGSVEDGIQFIRSFKRVYIHPRCVQTAREFRLYSWEIDKLSGAIKPKPVDANNHYIDALRYALNPIMKHVGINWAALGS
jgi:phage terminase large subunit